MAPIALYVHIPFCARKCAYCDFASYAGALDALPTYLARLMAEIGRSPRADVSSVYIGGGTPSLLSGDQMAALMGAARDHFHVLPDAEITTEANPGTVDEAKLRAYRGAGINRISLGAQAMQPRLLDALGRIHNWQEVRDAALMARRAGFQNLNIDLMYALPGQLIADWRDTIQAALELLPEHISAYSLILEEGTPLAGRVAAGALSAPDDDEAVEMQRMATRMLADAGLARYEISNYARPGRECRHNIAYWTRGEYLGLGVAAHSLMGGARFCNSADLDYAREEPVVLSERDAFEERVLLGTRMARGIAREGIDQAKIARLAGLVACDDERLWLTERGMELQNQVVLALI